MRKCGGTAITKKAVLTAGHCICDTEDPITTVGIESIAIHAFNPLCVVV